MAPTPTDCDLWNMQISMHIAYISLRIMNYHARYTFSVKLIWSDSCCNTVKAAGVPASLYAAHLHYITNFGTLVAFP